METLELSTSVPYGQTGTLTAQANSVTNEVTSASTQQTNQTTNSRFNETSELYFALSEDISQYQLSDEEQEVQNQIDQDVSAVVHKYTTNDKEGFLNFRPDLNMLAISFDGMYSEDDWKVSRELNRMWQTVSAAGLSVEKSNQMLEELQQNNEIIQNDIERKQELFKRDETYGISRDFKFYSDGEIEELAKDSFKNRYRLSDDISDEDLKRLYSEYQKTYDEKTEGKDLMQWLYENANEGAGALVDDYIIKSGLSKAEWIEHFETFKDKVQEIIDTHPDANQDYIEKLKETLNYHDNIINDLKELWGYGDLDVYS